MRPSSEQVSQIRRMSAVVYGDPEAAYVRLFAPQTREEASDLLKTLNEIPVQKREPTTEETMEDTKTCTACGETKPVTEYYKGQGRCKPCYNRIQNERKKGKQGKKSAATPKPEPAKFTPADEDLDIPEKGTDDPHWCIAELRDPRLSTVTQAQKMLSARLDLDITLEDTAGVLSAIADLDLA